MMKRLALTIALAGLSGGALAADLRGPIIEAPPPLPVPVAGFSWTGGYAGVNVGVGTADANYHSEYTSSGTAGTAPYTYESPPCSGSVGYDSDTSNCIYSNPGSPGTPAIANSQSEHQRSGGVLGGVQAGYNYAFGTAGFGGFGGFRAVPVIGVEADFDGSGVASNGTLGGFASGALTGGPTYVSADTDIKYVGTVRGRLGVAFDRLLVFGTGGFAYGETESVVSQPANGLYSHTSNFHTGIAYGGGLEFALTNNLLLRAEYLHYDFNKKRIAQGSIQSVSSCGCETTSTYAVYEKPGLDVVRAGLSYKFDSVRAFAPPVIARY